MQPNPKSRTIEVKGMIGETTDFFRFPLDGLLELILDLKEMTLINSIGVKNWILWVNKVPEKLIVRMRNCPYVISNQASTVHGFLKQNFVIESMYAPFICPNCNEEKIELLIRGTHYEYALAGQAPVQKLPEPVCQKCTPPQKYEPDFYPEKTFKFLQVL
jgi:hypothetical protein